MLTLLFCWFSVFKPARVTICKRAHQKYLHIIFPSDQTWYQTKQLNSSIFQKIVSEWVQWNHRWKVVSVKMLSSRWFCFKASLRGWGFTLVLEWWSSKWETLGSVLSTKTFKAKGKATLWFPPVFVCSPELKLLCTVWSWEHPTLKVNTFKIYTYLFGPL